MTYKAPAGTTGEARVPLRRCKCHIPRVQGLLAFAHLNGCVVDRYKLEKDVSSGGFDPLPETPLIRLEMAETYCTEVDKHAFISGSSPLSLCQKALSSTE